MEYTRKQKNEGNKNGKGSRKKWNIWLLWLTEEDVDSSNKQLIKNLTMFHKSQNNSLKGTIIMDVNVRAEADKSQTN